MPVRVFNWDRQAGVLLNPQAAIAAGTQNTVALSNAAAFNAIVNILSRLNSISLQWRVQNELANLQPSINSEIPNWADNNTTGKCYDPSVVGALVHTLIWQGDAPIGMPPPQGFISMFIGDCGLDPVSTFTSYIATPMVLPSGPANSTVYYIMFWCTLDPSSSTSDDSGDGGGDDDDEC